MTALLLTLGLVYGALALDAATACRRALRPAGGVIRRARRRPCVARALPPATRRVVRRVA